MVSTVGNYDKKDGMNVLQEVSENSVCSKTCVNQVKKRDSCILKAEEKSTEAKVHGWSPGMLFTGTITFS